MWYIMRPDLNYYVNRALAEWRLWFKILDLQTGIRPGSLGMLARGCRRNQNGRIGWTWYLCGSDVLRARCWDNTNQHRSWRDFWQSTEKGGLFLVARCRLTRHINPCYIASSRWAMFVLCWEIDNAWKLQMVTILDTSRCIVKIQRVSKHRHISRY